MASAPHLEVVSRVDYTIGVIQIRHEEAVGVGIVVFISLFFDLQEFGAIEGDAWLILRCQCLIQRLQPRT